MKFEGFPSGPKKRREVPSTEAISELEAVEAGLLERKAALPEERPLDEEFHIESEPDLGDTIKFVQGK
jgi:hypothetical protein